MLLTQDDILNITRAYLDEVEDTTLLTYISDKLYYIYQLGVEAGMSTDAHTAYYTGLRAGVSRYSYYAFEQGAKRFVGPDYTTTLQQALDEIYAEENKIHA